MKLLLKYIGMVALILLFGLIYYLFNIPQSYWDPIHVGQLNADLIPPNDPLLGEFIASEEPVAIALLIDSEKWSTEGVVRNYFGEYCAEDKGVMLVKGALLDKDCYIANFTGKRESSNIINVYHYNGLFYKAIPKNNLIPVSVK
jgi:hypothetical protein